MFALGLLLLAGPEAGLVVAASLFMGMANYAHQTFFGGSHV